MPWKIEKISIPDQSGKTVDKNIIVMDPSGNPVWIHEHDKKEVGVDAGHYFSKIPELLEEQRTLKKSKKDVDDQLAALKASFDGIDDPVKAKEALDIIKNLDAKKLVDAKKIDELKMQLKGEYDQALLKVTGENKTIIEKLTADLQKSQSHIHSLTISNAFRSSKILNGEDKKVIVPVDMAEKYWADYFKPTEVNGKLVPVASIGDKPIYSKEKPGELADFDEAIMTIISDYCPFKESILKGNQNSGGGSTGGGNGGGNGGVRDISSYKSDADFKTPKEKQEYITKYGLDKFQGLVRAGRSSRVSDMKKAGQAPLHK